MTFKNNENIFMSDINVTPFVDVMLVLLIIFMVTAPMMTQGVNVSLPEVSKADPLPLKKKPLIISIDNNNAIYIDDRKAPFAFFYENLLKHLENRENREVFLKADKKIPYGTVVHIMSEINRAGVKNLGIVALSAEESFQNTKKQTKKR